VYSPIDERTIVRELVIAFPRTREVFESHAVDYCCGGNRDLRAAASESGAELETLLRDIECAVVEMEQRDDDGGTDWAAASLAELTDHILAVHHAFLRKKLPEIDYLLERVWEAHGAVHGGLLGPLKDIFLSLKTDLASHLIKEEKVFFPFIKDMEAHAGGQGTIPTRQCGAIRDPIRQLTREHEHAGAALAEMRAVSSNYLLPADACPAFASLYDELKGLERDLHEHIHLENNILFPRAIEMEQALSD
jgi:regulator of cell morphogenesis and NO signaling